MASKRQRDRRQARRVQHELAARNRRTEALLNLPEVASFIEMRRLMAERGYEQTASGKWKRIAPVVRELRKRRK